MRQTELLDPWLRVYRAPRTASHWLMCLPHAGSGTRAFGAWASLLPDDVELLVARYPGRQDRIAEPNVDAMDEVAGRVTAAALAAIDDLPVSLFGHSMGASIGFEVTRRMRQAGRTPRLLLVSGSAAPGDRANTAWHMLPDADFLAEVVRLGGTAAELVADAQLRDLILPALRADCRLVETYLPAPDARVDVPIVAYGGSADPVVAVERLHQWAAATTAPFDQVVFPGGHFFLEDHRAEVVRDVVARIRGASAAAAERRYVTIDPIRETT